MVSAVEKEAMNTCPSSTHPLGPLWLLFSFLQAVFTGLQLMCTESSAIMLCYTVALEECQLRAQTANRSMSGLR